MNKEEFKKHREKMWQREDKLKELTGIRGCRYCPYYTVGYTRPDEYNRSWQREYCGKGNFNLNNTGYQLILTSHNKVKEIKDYPPDEWDNIISIRCPYYKIFEEELKAK